MSDLSDSDSNLREDEVVFTEQEVLRTGLNILHYTKKKIRRAKRARNLDRFKGHYGVLPVVVCELIQDLQTELTGKFYIPRKKMVLQYLLMALHHLKRYPTELEREPLFDISFSQGRQWIWYFIERIRALKHLKIRWPDDGFGDDIWVLTVDGQHCWIQEPQHPTWSIDTEYYSHKYAKAGLDYELAIAIRDSHLVWMAGPFPAGKSDNKVFKQEGLKAKLIETKKRGIADGGYPGSPELLSTPNKHDSKAVRKFKSRALKRHERFNGMMKEFESISGRFRHSVERFGDCFEAIAVLCQYRCEHGEPLYDVLVDDGIMVSRD
jgi:hypothetical protein